LGGWPASAFLADWQRFGFDDPALATLAEGERPEWPGALDRLGLPAAEDLLAEAEPAVRLARRIDARLGELASAAGGIPFGPERVFAFLWALRMEALHLRLVLTAAAFGIPEDRVVGEWRAAHG
jgi:hypothetical protein